MSAMLIVEDDTTIRVTLGKFLARLGYSVDVAESAAGALKQVRSRRYRLILLDLHLPDGNGLDLIGKFREMDEDTLVVIMTAFPEVRTAVAALKAGAYDYITKPFDLEDMQELVGRAMETSRLRQEVAWRRAQSDVCQVDGVGGDSPAWQRLTAVTQKIAGADHVPVLICGEELAALRQDASFQAAFRKQSRVTLPATVSGRLFTRQDVIYVLASFLSLDTRSAQTQSSRPAVQPNASSGVYLS